MAALWLKIRAALPENALADSGFLCGVVALASLPYLTGLGFYWNDWHWLGHLDMGSDPSLSGLFDRMSKYGDWIRTQPVKVLLHSTMYWCFGLSPLGYHVLNLLVAISNVLLFYFVLRYLGQERILSFSAAVLYGVMPHYSSARFSIQGIIYGVSITFYFLSLLADLRAMRSGATRFWRWKIAGVAAMVCSTLTHSIATPFFLLTPVFVWYRERRRRIGESADTFSLRRLSMTSAFKRKFTLLIGLNVVALSAVLLFKLLSSVWWGNASAAKIAGNAVKTSMKMLTPPYTRYEWGLNYLNAMVVNFIEYGIGLLAMAGDVVLRYGSVINFSLAAVVGIATFSYMKRQGNFLDDTLPGENGMIRFVVRGFIVFVIGYTSFLFDGPLRFSTTGPVNVTAIAASLGVALVLVGTFGWLGNLFKSSRAQQRSFNLFVAIYCTACILITSTLGTFWTSAYRQEKTILTSIETALPQLPSNSTLLLDGYRRYAGPAPLFETKWDLPGGFTHKVP